LRALRLLGFRPLPLADLLAFHRGELNELPHRRFVVTVDDAMVNGVEPLRRTADLHPQLFLPTNGDHDEAVCRATEAAGYEAALHHRKGRNDCASDPFRLRRVSVHGTDDALAVLWKVLTGGEALTGSWPRLRR